LTAKFATFWKCALQVNPRSYIGRYQGRDHGLSEETYNKAIAQKCITNEIRVVGIADHGTVEGIEQLSAVLQDAGVVVLPGFEIASTEKVHMVCLFPEGTDVATLNKHLGNLNAPVAGRTTAPSSLGCIEISKRVHERGGFWYAAHVTGASGLLRLNQDGGGLAHIWCDCERVLAAQIPGDTASVEPKVQQILRNKNPDYKRSRPIALLNAKDVRAPEDLDDPASYSWVKMTVPSLEALELACRDPESRIRFSNEVNPAYYSRIERVAVRRGYLDDLEIELSPNLNALVGGRGTGKSTFIEAIRYALDLDPLGKDSERAHKGIIDANFAKEKASIELTVTSYQQNCDRYTVLRQHGDPAQVPDENGTVLKLSPSDILPTVEVYGQNELLAIVQDSGAKAKLLKRFLPNDDVERNELVRLKSALRQNRSEVDSLEVKVADMATKLELLCFSRSRQILQKARP
jgi:PHP family Zn ribbon phosphoesterase